MDNKQFPEHAQELLDDLRNNDGEVRRSAVWKLREIGDTQTAGPVSALLSDEDWTVRYYATLALASLKNPITPDPLINAALSDENEQVREGAIHALGEIGDTRAVEGLIAGLSQNEPNIRFASAYALAKIRPCDAIDPLIKVLGDGRNVEGDIVRKVRDAAIYALEQIGEPAIPSLSTALNHEGELIRIGAATILAKRDDRRAVEALLVALEHDDVAIVRQAIELSVNYVPDDRLVEPLISLLNDQNLWIRSKATEALGRLKAKQAIDPLISKLNGGYGSSDAAWALGEIGDKRAVEPLIECLHAQYIFPSVPIALAKLGDSRAIEPLVAALPRARNSVKLQIERALQQLGCRPSSD